MVGLFFEMISDIRFLFGSKCVLLFLGLEFLR